MMVIVSKKYDVARKIALLQEHVDCKIARTRHRLHQDGVLISVGCPKYRMVGAGRLNGKREISGPVKIQESGQAAS